MKEFDDARTLLTGLQKQLETLNELIRLKEQEYSDKQKKLKESERYAEEVLDEAGELQEILKRCSVGVCQYKTAFEEIRNKYSDKIEKPISNQNFHFFLCYRGEYYARDGKTVIDSHEEIIDKHGFCWWGKFFRQRIKGGDYQELEPFGESIRIGASSNVARNIKEKVKERISNGNGVYLFNYSPNPSHIKLYVCNVIDFYYGDQVVPNEDIIDESPPECCYIPRYYFHKKEGNCKSCKKIDATKCKLRFVSNFWFKIDEIKKLTDVNEEFTNLLNCFTNDSINFAIPILYPLLVYQKKERLYFPEKVEPIRYKLGYELHIPEKEKAHTKTPKVKKLFDDLNKKCGQSFVQVKLIDCPRVYSGKPELQKSGKDNEILLYLPPDFRIDPKAARFSVCLDVKTKPEQKKKVEALIRSHLK